MPNQLSIRFLLIYILLFSLLGIWSWSRINSLTKFIFDYRFEYDIRSAAKNIERNIQYINFVLYQAAIRYNKPEDANTFINIIRTAGLIEKYRIFSMGFRDGAGVYSPIYGVNNCNDRNSTDFLHNPISRTHEVVWRTLVKCGDELAVPVFLTVVSETKYIGNFIIYLSYTKFSSHITGRSRANYALFNELGYIVLKHHDNELNAIRLDEIAKNYKTYIPFDGDIIRIKNPRDVNRDSGIVGMSSRNEYGIVMLNNLNWDEPGLAQLLSRWYIDVICFLMIYITLVIAFYSTLVHPLCYFLINIRRVIIKEKYTPIEKINWSEFKDFIALVEEILINHSVREDQLYMTQYFLSRITYYEEAKLSLLRNIQHEINTPMHHVISKLQSIMKSIFSDVRLFYHDQSRFYEEKEKAYRDIITVATYIKDTIEDMTSAFEYTNSKIMLNKQHSSVKDSIYVVISNIMTHAIYNNIKIELHNPDNSPLIAFFDFTYLTQALQYIMQYAINFNGQNSKIVISLSHELPQIEIKISSVSAIVLTKFELIGDLAEHLMYRNCTKDHFVYDLPITLTIAAHILALHGTRFRVKHDLGSNGAEVNITLLTSADGL